jgi:hypothetical protein
MWDERSPWTRYIMQSPPPVQGQASVLWSNDVAPVWFLLREPAYVSRQQGSGLLFTSRTAAAWEARAAITRGLVPISAWHGLGLPPTCLELDPPLSAADIAGMCASPDGPGSVVTNHAVAGLSQTAFDTPAAFAALCHTGDSPRILQLRRFYLHQCAAPGAGHAP